MAQPYVGGAVDVVVVAGLFLMRQLSVLNAFERSERLRLALRRSSEDRFTRAFHGVPLGAAILTESDARVVDANDRALELLALSRSTAIGGPSRRSTSSPNRAPGSTR